MSKKKHLLINDSGEMIPIKHYLFMEKNSPIHCCCESYRPACPLAFNLFAH